MFAHKQEAKKGGIQDRTNREWENSTRGSRKMNWKARREVTHLSEEPGDNVTEDNRLVGFMIVWRGGDACEVPEVCLPLVETRVLAAGVEEKDVGSTLYEPAAIKHLDTGCAHAVEGSGEVRVGRFLGLDLHWRGLVGERADECVAIAIFGDGDGDFGLDDGVDTANLVGDLPSALEEEGIANVALNLRHGSRLRGVVCGS